MADKSSSGRKDDFENSLDYNTSILWTRLKDFVSSKQRIDFLIYLLDTAEIELNICGTEVSEKTIKERTKEYVISLVPQIYDKIMTHFSNQPNVYHSYNDCGYLEVFNLKNKYEWSYKIMPYAHKLGMNIKKQQQK